MATGPNKPFPCRCRNPDALYFSRMNHVAMFTSVVVTLVITTLSAYAQPNFFGPMASTSLSTSTGTDVSAYGTPTRYAVGVQYARRSETAAEYAFSILHRIENGGYITEFIKPSGGIIGRLHVVDVPGGSPSIVTTLESTSIELGATLRFPILKVDTIGTRVLLQVGVYSDRTTSMTQVSDYSRVPEADRGSIPMQTTVMFDSQFGFGGQFGFALSIPAGNGRFLFELNYNVRQPSTIAFPAGVSSQASEQNIGWLVGRSLRLGTSYQFRM